MLKSALNATIISVIVYGAIASADAARASEWGCQVLLCAASDNPSWQGVQSCHPPMERLMSAMKRPGFSWPTCPEGGAGKPGYERYDICPSGWSPSRLPGTGGEDDFTDLDQCSRAVERCGAAQSLGDGRARVNTSDGIIRIYSGLGACNYVEFAPRPLRSKPYFFDIRPEGGGGDTRHYFSLNQ